MVEQLPLKQSVVGSTPTGRTLIDNVCEIGYRDSDPLSLAMNEIIYDNSDVIESYSGVTLPLTFSFARRIYQLAFTNFAQRMGLRDSAIHEHAIVFEHTIEHIGYHVYNNVSNRKVLFSLFPLFSVRTFLMFVLLKWRIRRFNTYFEKTHAELQSYTLEDMNIYELQRLYHLLEKYYSPMWGIPIANDFALKVSTELSEKVYTRWVKSDDTYEHMRAPEHVLLFSVVPGLEIWRIAETIRADKDLLRLLSRDTSDKDIFFEMQAHYSAHPAVIATNEYIRIYGARMPDELKLEQHTLAEQPERIISLLKNALRPSAEPATFLRDKLPDTFKHIGFFKALILRFLLRWASNCIHDREKTRFYRTLLYGHVRRICLAIGDRMKERGTIDDARDIFYLTIEEVLRSTEIHTARALLLPFIAHRKKECDQWELITMPTHIESSKSIKDIERDILDASPETPSTKIMRGRVVSRPRGVQSLSGKALVLKHFDPSTNYAGKVIIARQTDPGWTIIFPFIKGIVVERGGMLSHASIVARELSIPCIMGVESATDIIENNMPITLDLHTGIIYPS